MSYHKTEKHEGIRVSTRPVDASSEASSSSTHPVPPADMLADKFDLHAVELFSSTNAPVQALNGRTLRPAPTQDPRDPLNLSQSRKILACFFLCFYGAMAGAAELILGAMLPVFVLQYAGIDPKTIVNFQDIQLPPGTNPLVLIASLPGAPPVWKVYLLGSLPVLVIGITNLVMVPIASAVGRRPVILCSGLVAIAGAIWAGYSQSLDSHLGARCVQAVGAGTVESLIPFVISDMTFDHQRNTWISYVFATQGLIIVGLGFAAPYIIIYLSWRWLYYITAICAAGFLVGVFFTLPETRWRRTPDEIRGIPRQEHSTNLPKRTWKHDLRLYDKRPDWSYGLRVLTDALSTIFYPQVFFITLLSSAMIGATFGAGYTAAPPLIVPPWGWPFFHLTLCLIPILIASFGTVLVTGRVGDIVSNWSASRRRGGRRCPEDQLLNLVLPTLCGLVGTVLFGTAAGNPSRYPWPMFLTGLGFMAFGYLGVNTVATVYILECYPQMAGSALLNIASVRYILAFFLSFRVSEWVVDWGYPRTFIIYTIITAVCTALMPVLWWFGPVWLIKFPGRKTSV